MLTSEELRNLQKKVEDIVLGAGEYAFSKWQNVEAIQKGTAGDVVTEVDDFLESQISEQLDGLISGAVVLGEEHGGELKDGYVWLIDPIDGTKHYAHSMPSFYVQVALLYNNAPILGVVYDPVAEQLFSASKGNGTCLNSEKIEFGNTISIENAVVDIDFGGQELLDWKSDAFREIARAAYRTRVSAGRFALYLLTGGINAFIVLNPTTKLWDQAPRIILFEEAGFTVEQFEVDGHKVILASKGELFLKIKEIIINTVR